MRPLFDLSKTKFEEDARVKFTYTSPEHHQNIEISIDGEETSVEVLLETFQRFLWALGIPIPPEARVDIVMYDDDDDKLKDGENDKED